VTPHSAFHTTAEYWKARRSGSALRPTYRLVIEPAKGRALYGQRVEMISKLGL
jgi:hypothetical protein